MEGMAILIIAVALLLFALMISIDKFGNGQQSLKLSDYSSVENRAVKQEIVLDGVYDTHGGTVTILARDWANRDSDEVLRESLAKKENWEMQNKEKEVTLVVPMAVITPEKKLVIFGLIVLYRYKNSPPK